MYELLKNRMTNGKPFLKTRALEKINLLVLDLTEEQTKELENLANQHGVEVLPEDAMGRLSLVEQTAEENTLMLAELIGGAM